MSNISIKIAKSAGFCFGVRRAISITEEIAERDGVCSTLGPLIHNKQVINRLYEKGVRVVNCIDDAEGTLIIRSHGVSKSIMESISDTGLSYVDATCPFVSKIHDIVYKQSSEGKTVIVAGDPDHAEVLGIVGHCIGDVYVVDSAEKLENLLIKHKDNPGFLPVMVSQTTFDMSKWLLFKEIAKKHCTNIHFFDTICSATANRQRETEQLAKSCDLMVVIGGFHSSNTKKLAEICQKHCPTIFTEDGSDIDKSIKDTLKKDVQIGITAGASTPAYIIKEVHRIMSEILKDDDMDIDFMAEVDKTFKRVYIGNRVKAVVVAINNTEAVVDLGTKHSGYIPANELSHNPNAVPKDIVSVGDEIDAIVTSINDAEGVVILSKKRVDSVLGLEKLIKAQDENETLTGDVTSVVKGGVIVVSNGTRVFIPASQTGVPRDGKLDDLLKKTVKFKVIEVTEARGRVVGSIRQALREESDAAKAKFWESVEVGQKFTGEVKSMESYGVFVDLGGVDGMVHSSELTWNRIKHPKEVVSIGEKLEVYVKSFDLEKKRVSLGCKDPADNPWTKFVADFHVDDIVTVKIVSITPFGAFAQIVPGVDGLIHISQISNERVTNVAQILSMGQEVDTKIIEIDEEKNRVSLSIKVLIEDDSEAVVEDDDSEEIVEEAVEDTVEEAVSEDEAE